MLIQPREYLVVTSHFVNFLVLVSWFCIIGSYLIGCALLFCEYPLCAVWTEFFFMARQPYMCLGLLVSSRFHGHTHFRHTTLGRTPLDEGPARRRDVYLTSHNTHNRQTSMLPVGFEPTILVSERPKTHDVDRTGVDGMSREFKRTEIYAGVNL
jgi:hypothetical protein